MNKMKEYINFFKNELKDYKVACLETVNNNINLHILHIKLG